MPFYEKPTEYPEWGSGLTVIPGWSVSTAYTAGNLVSNAGAIYVCTTSGTSASSGDGPASAASSITDGTAVWRYSHPAERAGPAVEPSTYMKQNGLPPEHALPSGHLNWLFLTIWQWLRYLGSLVAQAATWTAPQLFQQTLSATNPPGTAWQSATAYAADTIRTNDSGKVYIVTTAGTSAGSGGPTGTSSAITDGTVVWKYLRGPQAAVTATSTTSGQAAVEAIGDAASPALKATPYINLVPTASAPSSPANGDMWYDSGSHTIKARINGATVTITTA